MIPIQAILIAVLVLMGGIYFTTFSSRLASRLAVLGLLSMGVLFVVNPELTTRIAHRLGVGRGTDLLLYLFCVGSISIFLKLYKKSRTLDEKLTEVARQVALLGARAPRRGQT